MSVVKDALGALDQVDGGDGPDISMTKAVSNARRWVSKVHSISKTGHTARLENGDATEFEFEDN